VASRQEPLGNHAREKEFLAPDCGQTHVAGFARTRRRANARPEAPEKRDGYDLLPGREPAQNRVGDRVADRAKDQHPRPVPRKPGKAVIHLSGNDRSLASDQAADQRRDPTGIG
jgi:hypothetical protein